MNRQHLRFRLAAVAALAIGSVALADEPTSLSPADAGRHKIIPNQKIDRPPGSTSTSNGGWWGGSFLIALALCGLGGASIAAKKFSPKAGEVAGTLKVLGRTALTPKHCVHVLKAGDRILLVGTGPGGSPTLLGELDDPSEVDTILKSSASTSASMLAMPKFASRVAERSGVSS